MWVIPLNNADWDCFKTLISREILKIRNPLLEEHCAILEHSFVQISWICKKQTSISHSSTESDDVHKRHKSQKKIDVMENIDAVPSNVQSARQEALLYVFEDDDAVIKMIIKGRSLTMRHVSRTHRVALDWLFDRINLDSKNPNTSTPKTQLADIFF